MTGYIEAGVLIFMALIGAPLLAVIMGFAMLGHGSIGDWTLPVGSPIEKMFNWAMTDIWTLASSDNSITLSTIPMFTFAGYVMAEAKTANRLVRVAEGLFGWIPGGLAIVTVAACAFFTTFTGASGVTIVAIGGLIYPTLIKGKYSDKFSLGLVTGSGSIGLLFPPSLPIIVYGMVYGLAKATQHISNNFELGPFLVAGIIPGIVIVGIVSVYAMYVGVRDKVPRVKFNGKDALAALWEAKWEVPIPFFLIYVIATQTMGIPDSAAFTVIYVLIVECLVYRDVKFKKLFAVVKESMTLVGAIFGIIIASQALTGYFVRAQIPEKLSEYLVAHVHSKYTFLFALNVVLLIVGSMKDIFSAILVMVPLIALPASRYGIDPYQLGVIFLVNLELGYLMPPIGLNLLIAAFRFNRPMVDIYRAVVPFIGLMIISLAVVTYIPQLTAWSLKLGPAPSKNQIDLNDDSPTPVMEDGDGGVASYDSFGNPLKLEVCAAKGVQADDRLTCENAFRDKAACDAKPEDERADCLREVAKEFGNQTDYRYYPFPSTAKACDSIKGEDGLACKNYMLEYDKCAPKTDPDEKQECLNGPQGEYLVAIGLKDEEVTDDGDGGTDDGGSDAGEAPAEAP